MYNIDLPVVREMALFKVMKEQHFHAVLRSAWLQEFSAHVDLIAEGDRVDYLYVLINGCVELYASDKGQETTIGLVRPGKSFALADVVAGTDCLMSARTYMPTQILLMPASDVHVALSSDPSFCQSMMMEMAENNRTSVRSLKDIKLKSANERLVSCLLGYYEEQGGNGVAHLPCKKRTLASMLAMTPENLSRSLHAPQAFGVDVDQYDIHVNDVEALNKLLNLGLPIESR